MMRFASLAFPVILLSTVAIVPVAADAEPDASLASRPDTAADGTLGENNSGEGGFEPDSMPRTWWRLEGSLIGGHDSNVFVSNPAFVPGEISDAFGGTDLSAELRRTRLMSFRCEARKRWEGGLAARVRAFEQVDDSAASQSRIHGRAWFEWHAPLGDYVECENVEDQSAIGRGLGLGVMASASSLTIDGETFSDDLTASLGASYAWHLWNECELGRVAFRYHRSNVDDEAVDDITASPGFEPAVLDRSGGRNLAEAVLAFTPSTMRQIVGRCQGGGVFTDSLLTIVPSFVASVGYERVKTSGAEFRHEGTVAHFAGRVPIHRRLPTSGNVEKPLLAVDWTASYRRSTHDAVSVFEDARRKDRLRRLDIALLIPIRLESELPRRIMPHEPIRYTDWSVRVGAVVTNRGSNVDIFDYQGTVWTFSIQGVIGGMRSAGKDPKGPRSIGSHVGAGSGTAPERPQSGSDLSANASP